MKYKILFQAKTVQILLSLCLWSISDMVSQEFDSLAIDMEQINSDANDIFPIRFDSATLLFTSDRKNIKSEKVVEFAQTIYTSVMTDENWSSPERLSYLINSDSHDACVGISNQGHRIYVYKPFNNGDLYFSTVKSNGNIGKLKTLPINSDAHESSATSYFDTIYFTSNRTESKGKHDIFQMVISSTGKVGTLTNIEVCNSESDENYVSVSSDGKTLYFASDRDSSGNKYDIYKSVKDENFNWSLPEKMGYPINSASNDICPFIAPSGELLLSSDRSGQGYDIYCVPKLKLKEKMTRTVPLILIEKSPLETSGLVKFYLLKDSITLQGYDEFLPSKIEFNMVSVSDTIYPIKVQHLSAIEDVEILNNPEDQIIGYCIIPVKKDTLKNKEFTLDEVKSVINFDIKYCMVQVGAFYSILSVTEYEEKFPLLKGKVKMEEIGPINKFFINEVCADLDCAAALQKKCLSEYKSVDDTFIGVYSEDGERILIYFDVEKNKYIVVYSR